jgi:hypothetical protein
MEREIVGADSKTTLCYTIVPTGDHAVLETGICVVEYTSIVAPHLRLYPSRVHLDSYWVSGRASRSYAGDLKVDVVSLWQEGRPSL